MQPAWENRNSKEQYCYTSKEKIYKNLLLKPSDTKHSPPQVDIIVRKDDFLVLSFNNYVDLSDNDIDLSDI